MRKRTHPGSNPDRLGTVMRLPIRIAHGLFDLLLATVALFTVVVYLPFPVAILEWFCGNQIFRLGLMAVGIFLLLHYLTGARRVVLGLALAVVMILAGEAFRDIPFGHHQPNRSAGGVCRVLTYNTNGSDVRTALDLLDSGAVDLGGFVEIRERRQDQGRYMVLELQRRGYYGIYQRMFPEAEFGILLASRSPWEEVQVVTAPSLRDSVRSFLIARTEVKGRRVTVVALHLESVGLGDEGIDKAGSWRSRYRQIEIIRQELKRVKGPLIILGDFNTTPTDRILRMLKRGLADAWRDGGSGLGVTWQHFFPIFRIDYILTRGFGEAVIARRIGSNSDHFALKAELFPN